MAENTFWITGDIIFDLQTGKKSDVLRLAANERDASTFTQAAAETYLGFVQARTLDSGIVWSVERSLELPTEFVIKGVQPHG